MVAFNFRSEFITVIKTGAKRSTIRKSKRCNVGDTMQLYTGQRTKGCQKLADATCIGTAKITVDAIDKCPWVLSECQGEVVVMRDTNGRLHEQEGFLNVKNMVDFFENQYGLPFTGWIHTWGEIDAKRID